jgi:hypothetical protein
MNATSWISVGRRALLAALAAASIVAGCGGGVGEGGTGSAYAQGTITGFGSIFVNDIRFDDSNATVLDGSGKVRSRDDLRLGMNVEIQSGAIDTNAASAAAVSIRFSSELLGPVASVDIANGLLTTLGQTVQIDTTTAFDEHLAGIGAIVVGQSVEVYANYDGGSGRYRATRIEPRSGAAAFALRGIVGSLDRTTMRLRIGAADFLYAGAAAIPESLANGDYVRLSLQPGLAAATSWNVATFGAGVAALADEGNAELRGFVNAFTSTRSFSVNGQPVNAANASFPDGTAIGIGVRVEVEGSVRGGVVQAAQVSIRSDSDEQQHEFRLVGAVTSVDGAAKTFVLRGVTVSFANDPRVDKGTLADLAASRTIEVRGLLSSDGTRLVATRIIFED